MGKSFRAKVIVLGAAGVRLLRITLHFLEL